MTYNELKKAVKKVHGGLSMAMDVTVYQNVHNNKLFTDIIVSSPTDFVKYAYIDKALCFVHGVAYVDTIEKMKNIMEDKGQEKEGNK